MGETTLMLRKLFGNDKEEVELETSSEPAKDFTKKKEKRGRKLTPLENSGDNKDDRETLKIS